ncbi:MAG: 16S rRNA (uracil(1498)-N(3))-methyltransferase [Pelolinea sp.]|jgi:16S rRNA (uracil1498-N3)-methyltransferase|nr:16S rRNA (uracil(1498)-N(3))-methyltransferase [Pelolinea sp.]
MHRFFLPAGCIAGETVTFPEPIAHQIRHVLRLKEGMPVQVLDGAGTLLQVRLQEISEEGVLGRVMERSRPQDEPAVKLALCVSLTQREKFEWILQKNVEVGSACVLPFISRYSLAREKTIEAKRRQRWEDILREAAEQSGRILIPTLGEVCNLPKLIACCAQEYDLCLVAWEGERSTTLQNALQTVQKKGRDAHSIAIFIGPEGGFAAQEMEVFEQAGVVPVSLGKRILRMETAAIVAPALILYELGQMGL